jgi:DnaJ-class molecular chaperone
MSSGGQGRERRVSGDGTRPNPGDEASPEASQTAENICRACGGSGRVGGEPCPDCGGTGTVTETVGDA